MAEDHPTTPLRQRVPIPIGYRRWFLSSAVILLVSLALAGLSITHLINF